MSPSGNGLKDLLWLLWRCHYFKCVVPWIVAEGQHPHLPHLPRIYLRVNYSVVCPADKLKPRLGSKVTFGLRLTGGEGRGGAGGGGAFLLLGENGGTVGLHRQLMDSLSQNGSVLSDPMRRNRTQLSTVLRLSTHTHTHTSVQLHMDKMITCLHARQHLGGWGV